MVIGSDDCGLMDAAARVVRLLRGRFPVIASIFGATLILIVLTTAASILATAALGLIAFVPFVGLAALPLQLIAWVVRGIVFEFVGLTALVAYLRVYRESSGSPEVHLHHRAAV
jgi:membrane protein implicated in regulation of membrane protease activity